MKKIIHEGNGTKAVGVWIRVSTDDQAKGESPEHHEQRARYYAEAKGWNIKEVYHLEGVSGASVTDHPETKRMLADVKRGHITGLIFSKLARLARDTRQLLNFADYFRDANADLISLQESIDTSTPSGRLFYTMIAATATWEREEIADRVAVSVVVRAKMGKHLGGQAPFGYELKNKKLVLHPDEARVRKRMYELFLEHKRKLTVAKLLNTAGFRTRNGSKFSDTTVGRLLADPTAKGKHRLNYSKSRGVKMGWDFKPESEWEYADVEPIISPELWQQCNDLLGYGEGKRKRPTRKAVQIFGGLVFCACGQKMYIPGDTVKYTCQKCRNKIPADDLESVYVGELKGLFTSRERVEQALAHANESLSRLEDTLQGKLQEKQNTQKEIDRVYRLYVEEKLTSDQFGEFHKPLAERKKQQEDEVLKLEAEITHHKVNNLSADEVLQEATNVYTRWPQLEREVKRRIVESITDNIVVGTDEITVNLKHLPSFEELTKGQRNLRGSSPRRA